MMCDLWCVISKYCKCHPIAFFSIIPFVKPQMPFISGIWYG